MPLLKKNKGSALLTALFIMTVVAIAATAMSVKLQIEINRTELIKKIDSLYFAKRKILLCHMEKLAKNALKKQKIFTLKDEINSNALINNTQFAAKTQDLQAKFNLNNLADKKYILSFSLLIQKVEPKIKNKAALDIAKSVFSWLQPLKAGNSNANLANNYYLKQSPPYYPSHKSFVSISELRLIQGINQTLYLKLAPYVTALPKTTPINLNTASKFVLATLGNGLKEETVKAILQQRKDKPFKNIADLNNIQGYKEANIPNNMISLTSNYFLITVTAANKPLNLNFFEKIERKIKKEKVVISRLSETINTL